MRCSKCDSDNREGRKFCTNCGASLIAACSKCGAAFQPGERFCGECGAALSDGFSTKAEKGSSSRPSAATRVSTDAAATNVSNGERKTVTALFADLKGSTKLMESLDPE